MAQWHIPLQIASYKGVRFEVISLDEDNSKSLVEHAYPYVDGADLEDMGLGTHNVRLSAIYWGIGFHRKIKHLLATLAKPGGGVLVHPVMGRLNDMVVDSYSVRYSAEDVNYVAFDLSFRKSTPGNPIFISANSLIALLDKVFLMLNDFIAFVSDMLSNTLGVVFMIASEASAFTDAVTELFEVINGQFDVTLDLPNLSNPRNIVLFSDKVVRTALRSEKIVARPADINRQVADIKSINQTLEITLKTLSITVTRHLNDDKKQLIRQMVLFAATATLLQSSISVLEVDDNLSPLEINTINKAVRKQIQATIDSYQAANSLLTDDARYAVVERLREQARQFNELAESAINRKPPLVIKLAPFDTTLQQIAHHYYSDYRRTDELLRLNPHIRHPSFIKKDELINAYSQ